MADRDIVYTIFDHTSVKVVLNHRPGTVTESDPFDLVHIEIRYIDIEEEFAFPFIIQIFLGDPSSIFGCQLKTIGNKTIKG